VELHKVIDGISHLDPTADALWFEGRWRTWRDLSELGDTTLELVDRLGVAPEESIGVVLRNDASCAAVLLAALRAQRPVLTFSPLLPDGALVDDIRATRPAVVVARGAEWERPGLVDAVRDVHAVGIRIDDRDVDVDGFSVVAIGSTAHAHLPGEPPHHTAPGVAASMLTSGTTGPPKRAAVTPAALAAAIDAATLHHEGKHADSELRLRAATSIIDLPLFNISSYLDLATIVAAGRRICLLSRFEPWAWGEAVRDHNVIVALLVPAAMRMVLDAGIPKEWLASLRVVRSGSAPLDPALAAAFEETYDIPVIVAYGATEFSGALASLTMRDRREFGTSKRGSVGRPHPDVEIRIVDPADGHDLGVDEVGILLARAPQILATEAGGWTRTNDLARLDADGFLYIEGRADDVIIRGGFKIDPRDVAAVLKEHPDVNDAAVLAMPDERLGQVPVAAVVLRTAVSERPPDQLQHDLQEWVRQRRAPYTVPVVIRAVDALPRTPTLKVAQGALAELLRG
jgi:acyl-CoA synthetase (AMP-forming)/AMP-acid ligase II